MPRKPPRTKSKSKAMRPLAKPRNATKPPLKMPSVLEQARLAGATPGWWISDHLEELRHFVSWIYVGVHKIAQQWAQAKIQVYDASRQEPDILGKAAMFGRSPKMAEIAKYLRTMRTKSNTPDTAPEHETPIPDHPALKKLERPNPLTTGAVFRYQVACQLRLTGAAYIWEVPDQFGEPADMWVIPRGWARPMAPNGQNQMGYYQITPTFNTFTQGIASPTTSTYHVPYDQMIDIKWPNPLYPGEGTSPLSACSQIIDIMEQTDTATWASFVNSVKPSLVFNLDPRNGQSVTQQMLDQFTNELTVFKSGANNAGKVLAMLGLTVQQMMGGPAELDYVNGRVQNRENVLAIQGVAPVVAGLAGAGSYSEAAVHAKTTIEFSVEPDLALFSSSFNHRWRKYFGSDFRMELVAKAMDDPTLMLQKTDKIAAGFESGVASANEYRASLDLPPLDDPIADIPKCLLEGISMMEGGADDGMGGQPGMEGDPYGDEQTDGVDLEQDMPDDESTGIKNPLMQQAEGNRLAKAFAFNGVASANGKHK